VPDWARSRSFLTLGGVFQEKWYDRKGRCHKGAVENSSFARESAFTSPVAGITGVSGCQRTESVLVNEHWLWLKSRFGPSPEG
jgi:hypothetical protein